MKKSYLLFAVLFLLVQFSFGQQKTEPWRLDQLMKTEDLASRISMAQTDSMLILSIGPDALIKGSVDMGAARDQANLDKMREYLKDVPKDKEIVIYCGCCPFDRCPNIRPAFSLLLEMGFKEPKLLDIPQNIRTNWLNPGYPIQE